MTPNPSVNRTPGKCACRFPLAFGRRLPETLRCTRPIHTMSVFDPFATPFCMGIAAASLGIAMQRKLWPEHGYWTLAAVFVASIFGSTLLGRIALDIAAPIWATAAILILGVAQPLLFGMWLACNSSASAGRDDFARKGLVGILFAAAMAAFAIALAQASTAELAPSAVFFLLPLAPAFVGISMLRQQA